MKVSLTLPRSRDARAKIIRHHIIRERRNNAYWRAMSTLALYYSLGFRKFDVFDPTTGEVRPVFFDEKDGGLEYWSNSLLFEIQEIVGHMSSLDMQPTVKRTGTSLSAIRERSVSQVLLDSTIDPELVEQSQKAWAWMSAMYGMAGISTHLNESPSVGLSVELEVVHPEEILPFPSTGTNHLATRGMIRVRNVPIQWLKDTYGARKVGTGLKSKKMITSRIQFGENIMSGIATTGNIDRFSALSITDTDSGPSSSTDMEIAEIAELWIMGPNGTVSEYCVVSGDFEFEYIDMRSISVYPTLNIGRFYENGSWYGTSHFFMRYGSHRASERMLSRLFKNIREQDKYSVLVLPQGEYNEDTAFTDYGEALKVMKIWPDAYSETFRPFVVPVPNAGTLPMQAVQVAEAEGNRVNPVPDLIRNKGRVDSGPGLAALEASSKKAITNPEQEMIRIFSRSWRSAAQLISTALTEEPRPLPVKRLNLDMLGVIISDDDRISFTDNPIPNIRLMEFTVQENNPRSLEVRKGEAREALGAGLMTPDEYKLFLLKEGIESAMWMEPHKSIFERTVRRLLRLYGDGRTPGQMIATADTTRPDIELKILETVLYSDAIGHASPQVQDSFTGYKQYLEQSMGFALPQGVPSFEELIQPQPGTPNPPGGGLPPGIAGGIPPQIIQGA